MQENLHPVHVIDSHTEGEPTRLVVSGGPDPGGGSVYEQLQRLKTEFPNFRPAVVCEPRGSLIMVGALLCPPKDPSFAAGVIFFNDVGYLGMCGHGMIGVVRSLAFLGRIGPGEHWIETPVGPVRTMLGMDGSVSFENVPAYRFAADITVDVPELGTVRGEIAWGGNWFFLATTPPPAPIELANVEMLSRASFAVRDALRGAGIRAKDGELIEHVEWFEAAREPRNQSRNFVQCPGVAYDRSPCGTGTSAKMACLAAQGAWPAGKLWRQEGVLGTVFQARYRLGEEPGTIVPEITGNAWVTGQATLFWEPGDPFGAGIGCV